jgi:hypothetical protein
MTEAAVVIEARRSAQRYYAGTALVVTGLLITLVSAALIAAGASPGHADGQHAFLIAGTVGAAIGATVLLIGAVAVGVRLGLADHEASKG